MKRTITPLFALLLAGLLPLQAGADPVGLTFEGLDPGEEILGFYDASSMGSENGNYGPDHGVNFVDALASVDTDAGGGGDFDNAPSPDTVMFWLNATAVLNYEAGFDTGFSFFYSASLPAYVRVYNQLNGFGMELAYLALGTNWQDNDCLATASGSYCNWDVGSLPFGPENGPAMSIVFGGSANFVGFDNITFGSTTPIPLPAAVWLLGSGLAGLIALRRRLQPACPRVTAAG